MITQDTLEFFFLTHKSDTFEAFKRLAKRISIEKNVSITAIRSDRGGEFINERFIVYCEKKEIKHQLLTPRTPQ